MGRPKKRPEPFRWWEGGRYRSRQFDTQQDLDTFKSELRRRRQLGPLAPSVIDSKLTLIEFFEHEWWPRYAMHSLGEDTRRRYLEIWGKHLARRLGPYRLDQIDSLLIEDVRDELAKAGVGVQTQIKALMLLQGVLKRAKRRKLIAENPLNDVAKPKQPPRKPVRPLSPVTVESIRAHMLTMWASEKRGPGRSQAELEWWRHRNATMVSLLAYGGLRPKEMREAVWGDINGERLEVRDSKRNRLREVDLLATLAGDLREWRMRCGRPGDSDLIVSTYDGDEWRRYDWNNWRARVYHVAAEKAGVTDDLDPYRLRHSFVSLLLWAGEDPVYVADQAGHSLRTQSTHYAGVMRELRGKPRVPADEAIRQAREGSATAKSGVATSKTNAFSGTK